MPVLKKAARLVGALGALALAGATAASACAICLSAVSVTTADRLEAADRAALAMPDGTGLGVVAVVKGDVAVGDTIAEPAFRPDVAALPDGQALLLVREALGGKWTSLGAIDPANAPWLRTLASAGARRRRSGALRSAVVARRAPPRGSRSARGGDRPRHHRAAPLRRDGHACGPSRSGAAPRLDRRAGAGARRATYLLLLGIAGGADDATEIARRIEMARQANDATDLAALLAAALELEGPQRVDWIERAYIADRARTLPEIEAALLALAVHGDADATVPRARIVAAYRRFIREREPMAGFVAPELAEWEAWEATGDYVALLQANLVTDPAEEFAILSYIGQSPDAAAKAALADD